jgi:uncharacterized membrane protein
MEKEQPDSGSILHLGFWAALILKALNAAGEIAGGILIALLPPGSIPRIIRRLTHAELVEDPHDFIANTLLHWSSRFSLSAQHFGVIYLLSHGVIKLVLVILLWRRKLWAYPLTVVLLALFVAYQVYMYIITPSAVLIYLTLLDLAVIFLTLNEYRSMKKNTKT